MVRIYHHPVLHSLAFDCKVNKCKMGGGVDGSRHQYLMVYHGRSVGLCGITGMEQLLPAIPVGVLFGYEVGRIVRQTSFGT